MKTVTLSVNDTMANLLSKMSQGEIDSIMGMVQAALDDRRPLKEIMRDAQDQAEKNGLTQDKLDEILKELK